LRIVPIADASPSVAFTGLLSEKVKVSSASNRPSWTVFTRNAFNLSPAGMVNLPKRGL
jgi:hypothetical protein